jgi:hypothetical protein
MPVFFYLCLDYFFLCSNALVVLGFALLISFKFRDQYLFLVCLPYLLEVPGNSFLLTSFDSVFRLYTLLIGVVLLFFVPFLVLISAFYLFLTVNHTITVLIFIFCAASLVFLIFSFISTVFCVFLPATLRFLSLTAISHYSLMRVVFDITADSWLRFSLVVLLLCGAMTFCYGLVLFVLSSVALSKLFFVRFGLFFYFFLFASFFLPYDSFLHLTFLGMFTCLMELPILLRFVYDSYIGRVA